MINMLMKVVLLGLTALAATRMTTAATAVKKEAGSPQVGCHSDFSIRESQWVSWTNSKQEVELEGELYKIEAILKFESLYS